MESTLHALGGILLNGLPTFFLIILLNFYLKRVFFKPLEETLARRYEATEGARKAAREALAAADRRLAEYEAALRAARSEMYAEQEKAFRAMQDEQAAALEKARHDASAFLAKAKEDLARETDEARRGLVAESDRLAGEIADSILVKGVAA